MAVTAQDHVTPFFEKGRLEKEINRGALLSS